jgi:hypothetical protein
MKYLRLTLSLLLAYSFLNLASPAAQAAEGRKVSIEFRGPLNEALKQIAAKGSINLVVTGKLDEPAEVYLKNIGAEEALQAVANVHHLRLERQGSVWIIQPGEGAPFGPREAPAPLVQDKPVPPEPPEESGEGLSGKDARKKVREVTKDLKRKYRKQGSQIHHGDLVVAENETIREAVIYGGNLVVNGMSEGDAVTFGGNIEVTGHVGGNAVAIGGNVHLASGAVVDGDATAIGGNVSKEEGATVHGNTASVGSGEGLQVNVPKIIGEVIRGSRWAPLTVPRDDGDVRVHVGGFFRFLLFFALTFGLAFLALLLFPERIKRIQTELRSDPLKCGLTGVVGSMAVLAMTILMAVTLIGIPLSILLCIIYGVALVLGIAPVANEIGNRLPWFKGRRTQAGVLAMGTLVLSFVWIVPIMGPLIIALLSMIPLGAIIRTRFGQRSPPSAGPQDPILAQPA